MNTARAFGPAVITGFDKEHWVVSNLHPLSRKVYSSSEISTGLAPSSALC